MKLESLDDLLEIEHEKLKVAETKRLLTKIKQLVKEKSLKAYKNNLSDLPYKAVAIVDNKLVHLSFDLESGEARVDGVEVDSRDVKGRNAMAGSKAMDIIGEMVQKQKEVK